MFIGTQEQLDNSLEELGKRNGVTGESICDAARAELAKLRAQVEELKYMVYHKNRALRFIANNPRHDNCVHMVLKQAAKEALK